MRPSFPGDKFIENKDTVQCNCSEYNTQFLSNERGHFLTGSLKIIKNNKLHKLFSKGPKYREPQQIDWGSVGKRLKLGLKILLKTYLIPNVLPLTIFKIGNFLP